MSFSQFGMIGNDRIIKIQSLIRHETEAQSFLLPRFCGKGANFPIERITELKRMPGGGLECIMTLVPHLVKDGGVGSAGGKREGTEEAMTKFNQKLVIDELYHGVRNKGELDDMAAITDFRMEARRGLTYWHGNRTDQLIMLTASGISYAYNLDGSLRDEDVFTKLAFSSYVTAPSAKRHRRWDGTAKLLKEGDTTAVATTDVPSYKMLLSAKAYAKTHRMMPLKAGGKEWYVVLCTPYTLAMIKNDSDYKTAVIQGGVRGDENPFFTGATPTIDGLLLVEYEYVYTTNGATTKWGADGSVNGSRTLLWGAQAVGYADLGDPKWEEKTFEYGSQQGINVSKMTGILKPHFYSTFDKSEEDFSCLAIDHYMEQY